MEQMFREAVPEERRYGTRVSTFSCLAWHFMAVLCWASRQVGKAVLHAIGACDKPPCPAELSPLSPC